ncbi:hypothetical protein ACYZTL_09285 [Pseudomonas sp. LB3P81]
MRSGAGADQPPLKRRLNKICTEADFSPHNRAFAMDPKDPRRGIQPRPLAPWRRLGTISGLTLHNLGAQGSAIRPDGLHAQGLGQSLDMQTRGLESIARIAVSYFNTEKEIEVLLESLRALAADGE